MTINKEQIMNFSKMNKKELVAKCGALNYNNSVINHNLDEAKHTITKLEDEVKQWTDLYKATAKDKENLKAKVESLTRHNEGLILRVRALEGTLADLAIERKIS